jgi:acyl-CoA thioesterase
VVSEQSQAPAGGARLAGYFSTESVRTGEHAVSAWINVRDELCDQDGVLRTGPILYTIDMGTGLAMGLAVVADDRWVVTTDMDVRVTTPVTAGSLRVDAEVLRAGATTVVSAFTLHDESTGRAVGGGTCTGRPFPISFNRKYLEIPVGERRSHAPVSAAPTGDMATELGFRLAEGGAAEVEIEDWLKNPWGIMHGGVTSCLADLSAAAAGASALGRPGRVVGTTIRFLAPGRVGPARAIPRVLAAHADSALVEVRVTDEGSNGRLLAVTSSTIA